MTCVGSYAARYTAITCGELRRDDVCGELRRDDVEGDVEVRPSSRRQLPMRWRTWRVTWSVRSLEPEASVITWLSDVEGDVECALLEPEASGRLAPTRRGT